MLLSEQLNQLIYPCQFKVNKKKTLEKSETYSKLPITTQAPSAFIATLNRLVFTGLSR